MLNRFALSVLFITVCLAGCLYSRQKADAQAISVIDACRDTALFVSEGQAFTDSLAALIEKNMRLIPADKHALAVSLQKRNAQLHIRLDSVTKQGQILLDLIDVFEGPVCNECVGSEISQFCDEAAQLRAQSDSLITDISRFMGNHARIFASPLLEYTTRSLDRFRKKTERIYSGDVKRIQGMIRLSKTDLSQRRYDSSFTKSIASAKEIDSLLIQHTSFISETSAVREMLERSAELFENSKAASKSLEEAYEYLETSVNLYREGSLEKSEQSLARAREKLSHVLEANNQ